MDLFRQDLRPTCTIDSSIYRVEGLPSMLAETYKERMAPVIFDATNTYLTLVVVKLTSTLQLSTNSNSYHRIMFVHYDNVFALISWFTTGIKLQQCNSTFCFIFFLAIQS